LDVLSEAPYDVALHGVFANEIFGWPKIGVEDAVAGLYRTSNLSGGLPNNLGEVRRDRVVGVVFRDFIGPGLYGSSNIIVGTSSSRQIFSKCSECATRMLELTAVGPLLCLAC